MFSRIKKALSSDLKHGFKEYGYKVADLFLSAMEPLLRGYVTFHFRPMRAADVVVPQEEIRGDYSEYAIVLQGPVTRKNDFTLETLKLYRRYFHNALIILSTWEGEDANHLSRIRELGIEVLLNRKPADAGPLNINLQLMSSGTGIHRAMQMKKKYTLKTRTDHRLYKPHFLVFLSGLLKNFPIAGDGTRQKGRLIGLFASTRKLYYFTDMLVFGYTEDVALYFGAPHASASTRIRLGDSAAPFVAEQYLFTEFLKKIGYPLAYTPEDSLRALIGHCLLVSGSSLDWYSSKYLPFLEYRYVEYRRKSHFVSFPEWLNWYNFYGGK